MNGSIYRDKKKPSLHIIWIFMWKESFSFHFIHFLFHKLFFFSHYRSLPHSIASRHVIKNSSTRRFLLGSLNFNRFFISISDAMIYFCVHTILKNGKSIDSVMISFCQNKIHCRFFEWAKNVRNFFRRQLN